MPDVQIPGAPIALYRFRVVRQIIGLYTCVRSHSDIRGPVQRRAEAS